MKEKILKLIENNAKLTVTDIAKMLAVNEAEVVAAIAEMEADHIICGYDTIINWSKISEEKVNALIEVKVIPQRGSGFDKIANRISKYDEVDSIYLLSGAYDFIVQIKGKSLREVSEFVFDKLSTLESIQSTATHFVLKKYKEHGIELEHEKTDKRDQFLL